MKMLNKKYMRILISAVVLIAGIEFVNLKFNTLGVLKFFHLTLDSNLFGLQVSTLLGLALILIAIYLYRDKLV